MDYFVATLLALDLAARAWAYSDWKDWLKRPIVWMDLFILLTLLVPAWAANLGFLRLLRIWTVLNSDFFWRTVGHRFDDTRVEGIVRALSSLVTFVFVTTGFVYATFRNSHPGISGYLDALYLIAAEMVRKMYPL